MSETPVKVALGADPIGEPLKDLLKEHLAAQGVEVIDFGSTEDYPDVAQEVAKSVAHDPKARAVLVCGTGIGMAISANKIPGVNAAQAHDTYSAERARKSNNAQVITLGARVVGPELSKQIIDAWMQSEFQEGGSRRKVDKISALEQR